MKRNLLLRHSIKCLLATLIVVLALANCVVARPPSRVIEIAAGHNSRFKLLHQHNSVLMLTAGEPLVLQFTAKEAKTHDRDGFVHGFTLLRSKDRTPVPGWDFQLKPGVQQFNATAPQDPGEYIAVCSVMCSAKHDRMTMKVVVNPAGIEPPSQGEAR